MHHVSIHANVFFSAVISFGLKRLKKNQKSLPYLFSSLGGSTAMQWPSVLLFANREQGGQRKSDAE